MANLAIQFKKAVKYDARGRVALVGPAGSGKSYTALTVARLLAGESGKIAALDTEHGSLSKYADMFEFDVFDLNSYSPENFIAALDAAEEQHYNVFLCDSLSHFWVGKEGALEFVDAASKRHGDGMGGWKAFRPHERSMVDRMIASPCHILVTMRTKNEYVEEINPKTNKKQRRKIGLQPVQREGLEYEFDLVGYMDEDNTFIVDKTRCSAYSAKAISKPSSKDFEAFSEWLKGTKREEVASSTGIHAVKPNAAPFDRGKVKATFDVIERRIGHDAFIGALGFQGYTSIDELPNRDTALSVYNAIVESTKQLPDVTKQQPPTGSQAVEAHSTAKAGAGVHAEPAPGADAAPISAMPPEVELIWKRMTSMATTCSVFAELEADLVELADQDRAEDIYREVLGRSGVEQPNQFRNLGMARQAASALWRELQNILNEPFAKESDSSGEAQTTGIDEHVDAEATARAKENMCPVT